MLSLWRRGRAGPARSTALTFRLTTLASSLIDSSGPPLASTEEISRYFNESGLSPGLSTGFSRSVGRARGDSGSVVLGPGSDASSEEGLVEEPTSARLPVALSL